MTNEKQLENQEKVKMPWQGKIWVGFVSFILIIILPIFSILMFFYGMKINLVIILLIIIYFLYIILTIGFLKGCNWSAQVAFGFGFLDVFRNAKDLFIISEFDFIDFSVDSVFLIFSLFIAYLSWFCLKHPYYNQKKKLKSNNSVKI
ncbi:MAG: hypothetical protein KAT32_03290 [Candidatus Moranbacteria bacterium]|nr:hypothetical protein [Candidatus Moranbacteria bacterium]